MSNTTKERKPNKSNSQQHHNEHVAPFKLDKLFDSDSSWEKDQLCDVLHWIRQALALVCGPLWGAIPLVGGIWFILFLVISSGIIYGYYAMILKVDEEEFGGHGALLQEGFLLPYHSFCSRGYWYTVWHTFEQLGCYLISRQLVCIPN